MLGTIPALSLKAIRQRCQSVASAPGPHRSRRRYGRGLADEVPVRLRPSASQNALGARGPIPQLLKRLSYLLSGMGRAAINRTLLRRLETPSKKRAVTALFGTAWILAVATGLVILFNYESTPGRVGAFPESWPQESAVKLAPDRATLVMLAHPQCPCSRASVGELARIIARVPGKISAYVLFYQPAGSKDWENSTLQRSAAAIPGVTVLPDIDGIEAARFGAETSGYTLLFDTRGRLLFSGGVTSARGHAGDNAGERAVISLAKNKPSGRFATLVFGCSLADSPGDAKARWSN